MSIDKFGHYSSDLVAGSKIQRGPPGEGFKLTEDGNFNINNKRLCNVGDPTSDDEAVNVKYMRQNAITLSNDYFDVEMKKVSNLADPKDSFDAVNKAFLENTTKSYLTKRIPVKVKDNASYSFKNNRVTHIALPIDKTDAVNLEYIKENTLNKTNETFDAEDCIIERLPAPKQQQDATNKLYVDNKLPDSITQPGCCDFKQTKLINVADPIDSTDAINKQTLLMNLDNTKNECKQYADDKICYIRKENSLDFKQNRLTNVSDPKNETDVINKQTLVKVMDIFRHDLQQYTDENIHYKIRSDFPSEAILDFKNARLANIGKPVHDDDAVTKRYVRTQLLEFNNKLVNLLYKLYKDSTNDNPIISREEFSRIYTV